MMNAVLRDLFERKSVRLYEDRPVEDSVRARVLEAAFGAPTAGNMMLYSIIDVREQTMKDRLSVTCDNQPFIARAPMVLVFLADWEKWLRAFQMTGEQIRKPLEGDLLLAASDALIAAQNAVTAAHSLGLGSCYIGDILENYEIHRELLCLPKYALPVCMLCIGYPAKGQLEREKPRRFAGRYMVHENRYSRIDGGALRRMFEEQTGKSGEALDRYLSAFCHRKYQSDFSVEMSRSVREMIADWLK